MVPMYLGHLDLVFWGGGGLLFCDCGGMELMFIFGVFGNV